MDACVDHRASWHNSMKIFLALEVVSFDLTSALPLSFCSTLEDSIHVPLLGFKEVLLWRKWRVHGVKYIVHILCSCLSYSQTVP